MKLTNPIHPKPKKAKTSLNPKDSLPQFCRQGRTQNASQRQSPYISFRGAASNGKGGRAGSVEDVRRSCGGLGGQVKGRAREKDREKQNMFLKIDTTKNPPPKLQTLKPPHKKHLSCTQSPKNYQTQASEDDLATPMPMRRTNFKFMYQIGFGGFGKVWKVQERASWEYYAMKEIQKRKVIEKDSVDCIMNQRRVLTRLRHPFLVNIRYAFQDQQCLYLIMDYLKGADLRYHICYRESFTETQTKFILACLILALEQIHSKGIIHRDIKPQNLVLEETGYVRLTDFGIAKYAKELREKERERDGGKYDSSGTPGYMAPQVMMKEGYDCVADFFAVGVIGYELMLGRRPYFGRNRKEIKEKLSQQQVRIELDELPGGWSPESLDFINRLILRNPAQRLGSRQHIKQLKEHPWMSDINWKKLLKKQIIPPFIPNIVCETKEYLEEIQSYNEINQQEKGKERQRQGEGMGEGQGEEALTVEENRMFEGYEIVGEIGTSPFVTPLRNIRNTLEKERSIMEKMQKREVRQKKQINKMY